MKHLFAVLVAIAFLGGALCVEREQESGGVEAAAEETTVRTPVTRLRPGRPGARPEDDKDSDEDSGSSEVANVPAGRGGSSSEGDARCSPIVCQLKCQINGCFHAQCLDNGRCRCYCARQVDPLQAFFNSLLSSRLDSGGVTVRQRRPDPFATFGLRPRIAIISRGGFGGTGVALSPPRSSVFGGSGDFPDISKLFDEAANSGGVHAKVFQTAQQTCRRSDDCSSVCTNCTSTACSDNLCQCTGCPQRDSDIEGRRGGSGSNVLHTCRTARNCADHCKGCVITACMYGACECGQCDSNTTKNTTGAAPEVESGEDVTTESAAATTVSNDEVTSRTTEVLSVRVTDTPPSAAEETAPVEGHGRTCAAKRCSHTCWERQCEKWNCVDERCECDKCPEEVAVVVKNVERGKPEKLQDGTTANGDKDERNRYEIIF